jgi:Zn-dependent protease
MNDRDAVLPTQNGAVRLFTFAGIRVFLHWSWFLIAIFAIQSRRGLYSSLAWNAAEYVALFLIVLLHEFGHALACRQTGGQADTIILWPLGGVAYVAPPPRPGATLWAIVAGPLVNVLLLPPTLGLAVLVDMAGWEVTRPDLYQFCLSIAQINLALLIFNLLPIFPLDGGQILRTLLWFVIGRSRSLMVASFIGLTGAIGLCAWAFISGSLWFGIMAGFILLSCWGTLRHARLLQDLERAPRNPEFECSACHLAPPIGDYWICRQCRRQCDPFETGEICPHCQGVLPTIICPHCGVARPLSEWRRFGRPIPTVRDASGPPPLPSRYDA